MLILILQLTFTPWKIEQLRAVAQTHPEQLIAEDFTQKEIDAILTDKEYPILVPDVVGVFFAAVGLCSTSRCSSGCGAMAAICRYWTAGF